MGAVNMAKHSVKRAIEYQTKGERNGIIGAVVVGLIFLAFIGLMGSVSRYFGWGGAIAAFAMYSAGVFFYTRQNIRQRHDYAIGVGIIGGVVGIFINVPFPYGSITYNFAISNTFIGVLAAGIYVFAFLVLMFFGHYNTKHTDMR
jgi:hypothetical protein